MSIAGARPVGYLYDIHPLDLADYLYHDGAGELVEIVHDGDMFKQTDLVKIGNDYYRQSVAQPAITKRIK